MAFYDIAADPSTAVNAFLTQFKFNSNGDIRYVAGADTFHVWWLHRSVQKIAWDFTISGDDEINLSKPNPSTSEAIGTIITLVDHTTDYSVSYNITNVEAQYMFGGSISQSGGSDEWGGLIVLGSVNNPNTELQIISNGALLTSHWGTGINQTDGNTLLRTLLPTKVAGVSVDGGRIVVKANEWGDTYAVWRTTLGVGEKVASITTFSDPQNDTNLATVQGYTGISSSEGYQLIDFGDGSGSNPFYNQWTRTTNTKKQAYEFIKAELVRGTSEIIFGMDGDLFTGGPTFDGTVTSGTGTWVQNEEVTWTENGVPCSGTIMAVDDVDGTATGLIYVHLNVGIAPTTGTVLTGTGGATATIGVVNNFASSANHVGQYTGNWILAEGVAMDPTEVTFQDQISSLGSAGPINPPNNIQVIVNTNNALDPHVFLARKDPSLNAPLYNEYTVAAGNTLGNGTFVISESIKLDTPQNGFIMIQEGNTFEPVEYTAFSGSTFTLAGTLPITYTAAKNVFIPIMYDSAIGGADPKSLIKSLIYNSDISVIGWVRHGEPTSPNKPVPISGTITSAGFSTTVTLENE